eukprot:COSAG01_NODE_1140_length_11537_cov_73.353995_12_plen_70_part_00
MLNNTFKVCRLSFIHSFIVLILLLILEFLAQLGKNSKSQPDQSQYLLIEFFSGFLKNCMGLLNQRRTVK